MSEEETAADSTPPAIIATTTEMTSAPQATLTGALVVPALVALALIVLLLRPQSVAAPSTRPPLPTPVVLDELVPAAPGVQGVDAAPAARTKEGLRSLQAR